ncbi:unnamed protein product [Calypogeia fissa]
MPPSKSDKASSILIALLPAYSQELLSRVISHCRWLGMRSAKRSFYFVIIIMMVMHTDVRGRTVTIHP